MDKNYDVVETVLYNLCDELELFWPQWKAQHTHVPQIQILNIIWLRPIDFTL
jgi:hypothetical protein